MNRRNFLNASLAGIVGMTAQPLSAVSKPKHPIAKAVFPTSIEPKLLKQAKAALAKHGASLLHRDVIGIADYSLHSAEPRFHFVNLENGRSTSMLVAHGKGSDKRHTGFLQKFSNVPGSEASSGGSYVTTETYIGKHGTSRRLKGLESSNDLAEQRAIVMHGAWYVDSDMVRNHGKIGRSQGCFAFSKTDLRQVLERLGPGRLLYAAKV